MSTLSELLEQYNYDLPKEMVALSPVTPRDSAKLLVYNRKTQKTGISTFAHLPEFLPSNALLVFNNTKVLPARIYAKKQTGGIVEILATELHIPAQTFRALGNKKLLKGDTLSVGNHTLTILDTKDAYTVHSNAPLQTLLEEAGTIPIPPYLKHTPLSEEELRSRYQTVFAKKVGSIAAPTASLHFTPELLEKMHTLGIETVEVTLHVNLGTFAPLTEKAILEQALHEEHYEVSKDTAKKINVALKSGRPVIAVGTTAARTLESAYVNGAVESGKKSTRLFIQEGYQWKVVSSLITNFHVPQSSLLMLVAALVGRERLFELYEYAKQNNFRFFSFGDGMLII